LALTALVAPTSASAAAPEQPVGGPTTNSGGKYGLTAKQQKQIRKANNWAQTEEAKNVRRCRSGNNYQFSHKKRSGAYMQTNAQWRSFGGGQFAAGAVQAPIFAQNYLAWQQWRQDDGLNCLTKDWMATIYSGAAQTPVGDMLFSGTHDAGSSEIDVSAPCDIEAIYGAAAYLTAAIDKNACGTAILAKAQSKNLGAQLRSGARYLDLRVGIPADEAITTLPTPTVGDPTEVPLVLHHEIVSQPLAQGLGQVIQFANNHPKEQVILDFQHLTFTGNAAVDKYYIQGLAEMLADWTPDTNQRTICESSWSHKKFPMADTKLAGVPVKRAWKNNRNLIVVFPKGDMPSRSCYRTREEVLTSLWPNTEIPAVSTTYNHEVLEKRATQLKGAPGSCVDAAGTNWCGFFISQLQLTYAVGTQAQCLFGENPVGACSLYGLSQETNNDRAQELRKWRVNQGLPVNVAMIDFFTAADPSLVDQLLRSSWKLLN